MDSTQLALLSQLWLHEPDAVQVARAHAQLSLPLATPLDLATAYTDLLLLNVYPYSTAYTDAWGEINTPDARRIQAQYEMSGYQPRELLETGAPDHLGLCLGFLAYLLSLNSVQANQAARRFAQDLQVWLPICCFAVEREPGAHLFYRTMAERTRSEFLDYRAESLVDGDTVSSRAGVTASATSDGALNLQPLSGRPSVNQPDELRLRDVVRTLLVPSRCGLFLSRGHLGRIANSLGMRLPFGSRFEVGEWLFTGAGESGHIEPLLTALDVEVAAWASAYHSWSARWPMWQATGAGWMARTTRTRALLAQMMQQAQSGAEFSYALSDEEASGIAEG